MSLEDDCYTVVFQGSKPKKITSNQFLNLKIKKNEENFNNTNITINAMFI